MSEDVNELQKEWRAIVLNELRELKTTQGDLRKDIAEIKNSFAQNAEVQSLRTEVDKLKDFRAKAMGLTIAFQAVVAAIAWAISFYFHH